jgi:probable FeS assembly SUF system protein SufT
VLETIELKRNCTAIAIPSGQREVLQSGTVVRVMQSRGGSHTIAGPSHALFRIDAADGDALGFPQAKLDPRERGPFSEDLVWKTLKSVYDPEIPVNIVDLGLIYGCEIRDTEEGRSIAVHMSMTAPGCGMGNVLKADVETKLLRLPEVTGVQVDIVFDPPWTPARMSEAARLQLGFDLGQEPVQHLTQLT